MKQFLLLFLIGFFSGCSNYYRVFSVETIGKSDIKFYYLVKRKGKSDPEYIYVKSRLADTSVYYEFYSNKVIKHKLGPHKNSFQDWLMDGENHSGTWGSIDSFIFRKAMIISDSLNFPIQKNILTGWGFIQTR